MGFSYFNLSKDEEKTDEDCDPHGYTGELHHLREYVAYSIPEREVCVHLNLLAVFHNITNKVSENESPGSRTYDNDKL